MGQSHADAISFVFCIRQTRKEQNTEHFHVAKAFISNFFFFFFFRFLRNEPLIVFESDLLIVGFRVW